MESDIYICTKLTFFFACIYLAIWRKTIHLASELTLSLFLF